MGNPIEDSVPSKFGKLAMTLGVPALSSGTLVLLSKVPKIVGSRAIHMQSYMIDSIYVYVYKYVYKYVHVYVYYIKVCIYI